LDFIKEVFHGKGLVFDEPASLGGLGAGHGLFRPLAPQKGSAEGSGNPCGFHARGEGLRVFLKGKGEKNARALLCWNFYSLVGIVDLANLRPGQNDGRRIMSAVYIISGIVSAGLLIYLLVALLKPEKF
jgi:K+-transporting ATPase KdpF subunit